MRCIFPTIESMLKLWSFSKIKGLDLQPFYFVVLNLWFAENSFFHETKLFYLGAFLGKGKQAKYGKMTCLNIGSFWSNYRCVKLRLVPASTARLFRKYKEPDPWHHCLIHVQAWISSFWSTINRYFRNMFRGSNAFFLGSMLKHPSAVTKPESHAFWKISRHMGFCGFNGSAKNVHYFFPWFCFFLSVTFPLNKTQRRNWFSCFETE